MRIVTWNINGLRACLRRRFDGKLLNLLNFLEAGEAILLPCVLKHSRCIVPLFSKGEAFVAAIRQDTSICFATFVLCTKIL
jgi:hypothetical protein